uniref:HKT1 n=1 Tax=Arundo donax TaxID=35708 RepID=A0A0A9AMW1_ARUDO
MIMFSFTGVKPQFATEEMAVNTEKIANPMPFLFRTPCASGTSMR